ncbi:nicotinate phosphoribosyltransferase, partial [Treponema phagedenis]
MIHNALFLDFYELTMAQGYYKTGRRERTVFDMFFRRQPFNGGYSIFAGLNPLLEAIMNFRFGDDDIAYLKSTGIFDAEFLNYLSKFRFSGTVLAMDEGSVVFPNEPLIRVEADIIESLLLEGLILNTVNFQSLIATKTARIWLASNKSSIMEFGLRRAQGCDGAMSATRAAIIGGAAGTSNTLAAKLYGVPAMGTMAHAWVMSFDTEEEA